MLTTRSLVTGGWTGVEAGQISGFSIGQGFLLGATAYIAVPSLLVFLSLVLPAQAARWAMMIFAVAYILTIMGGALGSQHDSRWVSRNRQIRIARYQPGEL